MALVQFYDTLINNRNGNPIAGGTIEAIDAVTSAVLPIFADSAGTVFPAGNETTSDSSGMFSFFIEAGAKFKIRAYKNGQSAVSSVVIDTTAIGDVDADKAQAIALGIGGLDDDMGTAPSPVFTDGGTVKEWFGEAGLAVELLQKATPWVSVETFGAIGDGVADDYAAIQAALNWANTFGGMIVYAPKTYSVSAQLRIYSNTTLDMCGTGYIRRDFNTSVTGAGLTALQGEGQSNVAILNGTLDGNGQNFTQSHNLFTAQSAADLLLDNVTFLNVTDYHAVDLANSARITIRKCRFLGFANKSGTRAHSEAIQLDPGLSLATRLNSDVLVENCYFGDNPDNADPDFGPWGTGIGNHAGADNSVTKGVKIRNNTFDGMGYAGIRPFAWDDVSISGNTFIGCYRDIYAGVYTGTVTRGNSDFTIAGNTHNGATSNTIFFEDTSSGTVPTVGLTVTGNTFKSCATPLRLQNVLDFSISGNKAKATGTFVNVAIGSGCVNGNYISDLTGTGIFVGGGAGSIVNITGNTFRNLAGVRAVHISSATVSAKVNSNTIIDCSGSSAIQADGSAGGFDASNNTIIAGPLGLVPTTAAVNATSSPTSPQVTNNQVGSGVPREIVAAAGFYSGSGAGTPESAQTAPIGSVYYDRTNGVQYMKKSGTGNTGWKLVTQAV